MRYPVLPINILGKNLSTRVTKFFHIDSIGTLQQCSWGCLHTVVDSTTLVCIEVVVI